MARTTSVTARQVRRAACLIALALLLSSALAACGGSNEADAPDIDLLVTAGTYTTTVRPDSETEIPFSEVVYVQAEFKDEIYGRAGQTAVKITTDPPSYRVELQRPPDLRTYRAALIRRAPGTVTVSVYESSQSEPVKFTLLVGVEGPDG